MDCQLVIRKDPKNVSAGALMKAINYVRGLSAFVNQQVDNTPPVVIQVNKRRRKVVNPSDYTENIIHRLALVRESGYNPTQVVEEPGYVLHIYPDTLSLSTKTTESISYGEVLKRLHILATFYLEKYARTIGSYYPRIDVEVENDD